MRSVPQSIADPVSTPPRPLRALPPLFRDEPAAAAILGSASTVVAVAEPARAYVVAGLAAAFNTMIENGGAWPFHNMHLQAGLANGTLRPVVGKELPLSDAARAHEKVLEPGAYGKIVLVP